MKKQDGKLLYLKYKDDIDHVTPFEVMELEYMQLENGFSVHQILEYSDKLVNVFYMSLKEFDWKQPENDSFLYYMMLENTALKEKLSLIKELIKKQDYHKHGLTLISLFTQLKIFDAHYQKKENILFPCLEKKMKSYHGLKVMWELHDQIRKNLKNVIQLLENDETDTMAVNQSIGKLFFQMNGLIQKEQLILFPAASFLLTENEFAALKIQSFDYGFPFILQPEKKEEKMMQGKEDERREASFISGNTGNLSIEQLLLVFSYLPVDITMIDENNKVVFYSDSKDRIFKRSPAVIGRDVRNCHPPKSVQIVEKILDSFRNGEKSKAEFWITIHDKKVYITYYAVRNDEGTYKGTMEVTQDVTEIQKATGEKRLLDW
ncbi:MAG: DUF438 domain-containing protein [Clostridia bacterium]|nr:DUF438 domain-containing protein [Clostridia bacterium]